MTFDDTDLQADWFEEKDRETSGRLAIARSNVIFDKQLSRRQQNLRHAKLAANQDLSSIYDCGVATDLTAGAYLSVNVVESCTDTLTAKMTRTRIRPSLMTEKGSRSLQMSAEAGTDFIDGVYHRSNLHEGEGELLFQDGCLFSVGVAYTEVEPDEDDAGNVIVERVLPDEMGFDATEARYGLRSLSTLYRLKYIHRQTLYRMVDEDGKLFGDDPVKRQAIKMATGVSSPGSEWALEAGNMIPVRMAWHIPSRKGAGDGRFLVAIEGATLYAKEWKRKKFPFDWFVFKRQPTGLWGRSLAEQLVPIQLKINEQLEVIDEGQRLNAQVRLLYKQGAIDVDEFDNEVARLIQLAAGYSVEDVKVLEGHGASAEMYQDLETWIRRAYEVTGISMLSATAEKPEGITSAVALRELLDREDLRFSALGKRWERFHRDLGETILDTAAEAHEEGTSISVQVPGDKWAKTVDFGELKLDRAKQIVTVSAASSLPTTPAARKQYADDLLSRNAISMSRYLEIIDESGDVHGVTSMVTALQRSIDLDLELILDKGQWRAPEKLRDPALARDTALTKYAEVVHEAVPEKNLELLRRYILLATRMAGPAAAPQQDAAAQSAAAAQAQQGAAPAADGAPPMDPNASPGEAAPPDLAAAAPQPAPAVAPVL